ncbi:DUF99 family protein [Candidatus Woesearchaeota archaeon]|nr:DUF99 family protein [Candidatus Woesearchaeota archaeon]
MKKEIRVLGIDDAPFNKFKKGNALIIATVFRGGSWLEGILSTKASIDGSNATKKLADMINKSKFKPQLQCVFLDGIAVAGFNVIDVGELSKKTRLPVIVVMRKMPNIKKIKEALIKLNKKNKIGLIEKAGKIIKMENIYVQLIGIEIDKAKELLKIVCTRSFIPEPLRIAHLIASGIIYGESRGKA